MNSATNQQGLISEKENTNSFWYSRQEAGVAILVYFLIVQALSGVIPPLQPPDEGSHLSRAYLLSKGEVFLGAHGGETGGEIDSGLLAYMSLFQQVPLNYDRKIAASELRSARRMTWSGHRQFVDIYNTAAYFPLPYLPQACAFALGENLRLSLQPTYYLTRLFSLVATLGLLWSALLLYPMPPMVIAFFATPMTLSQMASANMDPITFGTCALVASLFLRGSNPRLSFDVRMHGALVLCVLSLATSRIAMIPLTLLPAALYPARRASTYLISSAVCVCLSLAWILFAFVSVKGMPSREIGALDTVRHYLLHPISLCQIIINTLCNSDILIWYWSMFVGVLGWVDTPLDSYVYIAFGILLLTLAALSIQRDRDSWGDRKNLWLLGVAVLSLALTFLLMLLTYTPSGSSVIQGIQGRYFTPIVIFLGYSIFAMRLLSLELRLGALLVFVELTLSVVSMMPKLLHRYWIS
jgi:uncharacterized membrane protein